ncbi:MAG TPA: M48 family metalloprotease [Candidatus Paceibacterota bacterium]|nr:M48 family metalloprotease [Candidatus Paceibacterota bacterium]
MATLYTLRSRNVARTWGLMAVFLVLVVAIGWAASYYYDSTAILYVALAFALVTNVFAYWKSDTIALASARAHPVSFEQDPELHRIVENLAITAGLPKPRIYMIDDPSPNAFATGRDAKHAAIAVTRGLRAMLAKSELEGVIAHELSHIGNRDILVMTMAVVLVGFIAILADIALRVSFLGGGGRERQNGNPVLLVFAILAIILAPIAAQLIQLAISRRREFLADASGALLTRYPEGLESALAKIGSYQAPMRHANAAIAHLFIANPFGAHPRGRFIQRLFSTHPPIEERIKALQGLELH